MDMKLIAEGFAFLEGPRLDDKGNIYFSDIHLGGFFRRSPDGTVKHLVSDRKGVGGLAVNHDGRIVASGVGGLILVDCDSEKVEILCDTVDGQPIQQINDIQPDGEGGIYAGCLNPPAVPNGPPQPDGAPLLLVGTDRRAKIVAEHIKVSNGIGLTTDGKMLYQAETREGVLAYDRAADGTLTNKRLALIAPGADGIAVDSENHVWVASVRESAVVRYAPDGSQVLRIDMPVLFTASLVFGGDDLKDLYVVTGSAINKPEFEMVGNVYLLRSEVAGQATPLTRF